MPLPPCPSLGSLSVMVELKVAMLDLCGASAVARDSRD
jgi:hypothetical protein